MTKLEAMRAAVAHMQDVFGPLEIEVSDAALSALIEKYEEGVGLKIPPVPADYSTVFTEAPPPSPLQPGVSGRREENQLRQLKAAMRTFGVPREWFAPDIAAKLDRFER